jgi:hypothetical protein
LTASIFFFIDNLPWTPNIQYYIVLCAELIEKNKRGKNIEKLKIKGQEAKLRNRLRRTDLNRFLTPQEGFGMTVRWTQGFIDKKTLFFDGVGGIMSLLQDGFC